MTDPRLEGTLTAWLDGVGATRAPSGAVQRALDDARRRRQRPAWLVGAIGLGWAGHADRTGPSIRSVRWVLIAGAVLLTLLTVLWIAGGGARPAVFPGVFACPAGSTPDQPGPLGQARPAAIGPAAFDRDSGQVVAYDRVEGVYPHPDDIWTFDVCTNTWHQTGSSTWDVAPSRELRGGYRGAEAMVYDPVTDLTVIFGSQVMTYDAESDSLVVRADPPFEPSDVRGGDAVFRAATQQIIVRSGSGWLWAYDVRNDRWGEIPQRGEFLGTGGLIAYDESVDRLVRYQPNPMHTWEFDFATSTWLDYPRTVTPRMMFIWGDLITGLEITYDEEAARTVVFSRGRVITYDATAHEWTVAFDAGMDFGSLGQADDTGDLTHRQGSSLVYDPVNDRVVFLGGSRRTVQEWIEVDDVIALDVATTTWRELLAQSVR